MKKFFCFILAIIAFSYLQQCNCYVARHGMTSAQYQIESITWARRGYRPKQVSGYSSSSGRPLFAAIWVKNDKRAWVSRHGMTSRGYQKEFNKFVKRGFRLVIVSGYAVRGRAYYAAIWERIRGKAWVARHGMNARQYQRYFDIYTRAPYHFRPTCVSAYTVNGRDYYAAIWGKNDGRRWVARHGLTSRSYQNHFNYYVRRGYRLTIVSGYQLRGHARYAAVWEKRSGRPAFYARHGITGINYQAEFDNRHYRGFKLQYVVGYLVRRTVRYAAIWHSKNIWPNSELYRIDRTVNTFLRTNGIPGASLAITRHGRLVFAQGYGKANVKHNHNASPRHLWRIASVSKPITSVAIMKLLEMKKLRLTDRVFGPGSILGNKYARGFSYSAREMRIKVQHLLEHTAGGTTWNNNWGDGSSDPMFIKNNLNHDQLITYILKSREPSAEPGTTYSYSNFGYCILGRIIEKLTGRNYESWVKRKVLDPMRARGMYIGGNTKWQRRSYEVVYYSGNAPYRMNVKRMDSHGGWITSPINLLKFMVRVDGFNTVPDHLRQSTIRLMTKPSSVVSWYAKGWAVDRSGKWEHGGRLPGTLSILVRTGNGYTWSFMCNKDGSGNIGQLMWKIINGVRKWPSRYVNFF